MRRAFSLGRTAVACALLTVDAKAMHQERQQGRLGGRGVRPYMATETQRGGFRGGGSQSATERQPYRPLMGLPPHASAQPPLSVVPQYQGPPSFHHTPYEQTPQQMHTPYSQTGHYGYGYDARPPLPPVGYPYHPSYRTAPILQSNLAMSLLLSLVSL